MTATVKAFQEKIEAMKNKGTSRIRNNNNKVIVGLTVGLGITITPALSATTTKTCQQDDESLSMREGGSNK